MSKPRFEIKRKEKPSQTKAPSTYLMSALVDRGKATLAYFIINSKDSHRFIAHPRQPRRGLGVLPRH